MRGGALLGHKRVTISLVLLLLLMMLRRCLSLF